MTKMRMVGLYFGWEVMWENWPKDQWTWFLNGSDTMIPCGKPKSNANKQWRKYEREIERDRNDG